MSIWEGFAGKLFDDRYEFRGLLGQGSWSEVVRAFDRVRSIEVAVKLLKDRTGYDVLTDRFFRNEFRAMATIDHPNVVRVLDFGQGPKGIRYYSMEVVPGDVLSKYISKLPGRLFDDVFEGLCHALWAVHAKGCLHCDVKPDNVMLVSKRGRYEPVLMDFGLNIDLSSGSKAEPRGTPLYAAPEMLEGRLVDARADIYSLGITLLEVLAGKLPFKGSNLLAVLSEKASNDLIRASLPSVPNRYRDCIARMTARDPRDRFPSCLAILDAMAAESDRSSDVPLPPPTQRHLLSPDLIGRERQLEVISGSIDDLARKKGGCIVIQGPRKSGKTRLLLEAKYYAQLADVMVISLIGPQFSARVPSLCPFLRDSMGLTGAVEKGQGGRESLVLKLQELAEKRPVALIMDNIHKLSADDSLLWSAVALRAVKGQYLVVSAMPARSQVLSPGIGLCLDAISDEESFVRLNLDSFSDEQTVALCQSMLGTSDSVAAVASLLTARTGGNPGACVDLLKELAQGDRLRHRLGQWSVAPANVVEMRKVKSCPEVKLGSLSDNLRMVLLAAAINGPMAAANITRQAAGLSQEEFLEQVLVLEKMSVLTWETVHKQVFLRFLHPALATRLVEKTDRNAIARLSSQAADVQLMARAKGEQFDPVKLVEHLVLSGRSDEALDVAISEGKRHGSIGELGLSIELLTFALKVSGSSQTPNLLQMAEIHLSIAKMMRLQGDAAGAIRHCYDGLSELAKLEFDDPDAQVRIAVELHREAGLRSEDLSKNDAAVEHYQRALSLTSRLSQEMPDKRMLIELQNALCWTQMQANRDEESEKTAQELLSRVAPDSYPNEVAGALCTLGWLCMRRGEAQQGLEHFGRVIPDARAGSLSVDVELQCVTGAAAASWLLGRWADALSYLQRALDVAECHQNPALRSKAIGNLAVAEYQLGRLHLAEGHLRQSLDSTIEVGDVEGYVVGLNNLGALLKDQGKNAEAWKLLQKARRIARERRYARHMLLIEGNMGELLQNMGEYERAESLLRKVLHRALRKTFTDLLPEAYRRMARIALALKSGRRFEYYARRSDEYARLVGKQDELYHLERLKAHYHISRNQDQRAEETFKSLASSLASSGAFFEEALTRLQWAELCLKRGNPSQAAQLLSGLEGVFNEAGAMGHFEKARELLRQVSQGGVCPKGMSDVLEALEEMRICDDMEAGLQSLAQAIASMTGADRGLIIGLNRRGMIQFEASANFTQALEPELTVSSKILKYVVDSQKPLLLESALSDPRFLGSSSIRTLQLGAVICCPVFVEDEVQAVLYADSRKPGLFLEERDSLLMRLVAQHVGLVLDNLRIRNENDLVEELIACLAHEMRSLLSGVLCSLKFITMPSELPLSHHVGFANEQVRRLSRLADETIDLIRCKSRSRALDSESVDMNALIRHITKTLEYIARERNLTLELELCDDLPAVIGQSDALERVVENLIINASKYTSPGGSIRIESRLRSSVRDQSATRSSYLYLNHDRNWRGSFASISVVDNGEGMDEDECERVFQKYARSHKIEREKRVKGSGLGLYICRKIVEQHGGRIWAVSQMGKGTDVTFTLPISPPRDAA
ncbi:MAG: protein kinase [Candidatus Coatesbacteria bacterium]|nr:protein kinase [Candidatus Coatesbacteria bacterium]